MKYEESLLDGEKEEGGYGTFLPSRTSQKDKNNNNSQTTGSGSTSAIMQTLVKSEKKQKFTSATSNKLIEIILNGLERNEQKEKIRKELQKGVSKYSQLPKKKLAAMLLKEFSKQLKKDGYPMLENVVFAMVTADSAVASLLLTFTLGNFPSSRLFYTSRMVAQILMAYTLSLRNAYLIRKGQNMEEGRLYDALNIGSQATFTWLIVCFITGILQPGQYPNSLPYILEGLGLIALSIGLGALADRETRDRLLESSLFQKLPLRFKKVNEFIFKSLGQALSAAGSMEMIIYTTELFIYILGRSQSNPNLSLQVEVRGILYGLYAGARGVTENLVSKKNLEKWDAAEWKVLVPFGLLWVSIVTYLTHKNIYAESQQQDEFLIYPFALILLTLMQFSFFGYRAFQEVQEQRYEILEQEVYERLRYPIDAYPGINPNTDDKINENEVSEGKEEIGVDQKTSGDGEGRSPQIN